MRHDHLDANQVNKKQHRILLCREVYLSDRESILKIYIYKTSNKINFNLTSNPLCWALQLLIFREPLIKSFCTSTIRKALIGLTIYKGFLFLLFLKKKKQRSKKKLRILILYYRTVKGMLKEFFFIILKY